MHPHVEMSVAESQLFHLEALCLEKVTTTRMIMEMVVLINLQQHVSPPPGSLLLKVGIHQRFYVIILGHCKNPQMKKALELEMMIQVKKTLLWLHGHLLLEFKVLEIWSWAFTRP